MLSRIWDFGLDSEVCFFLMDKFSLIVFGGTFIGFFVIGGFVYLFEKYILKDKIRFPTYSLIKEIFGEKQ
ncbi:hypothetical protein LCGC14_2829690 [marine sediment metagenome]|uniref:Uncharacterized protein n=1 Tax=marine sediment metagenome TaxID=412755 RepID=A0A0F8Z145_9ZZZZ